MFASAIPLALADLLAPGESARPVPGASRYWVTNHGRVLSAVNGARVLRLLRHPKGYLHVSIWRDPDSSHPARWQVYVHEIVALAFIGPRPVSPGVAYEVDHKSGDKADNRLVNLQYVTQAENLRRALAAGSVPSVKLTATDVWTYRCAAHAGVVADVVAQMVRERGVTTQTARNALSGRAWRIVPDPASRPSASDLAIALGLDCEVEAHRFLRLSPLSSDSACTNAKAPGHVLPFQSSAMPVAA